jgi:hypothetical protein
MRNYRQVLAVSVFSIKCRLAIMHAGIVAATFFGCLAVWSREPGNPFGILFFASAVCFLYGFGSTYARWDRGPDPDPDDRP